MFTSTLEVLAADSDGEVQSLAHRLQDHIAQGRLRLCEALFWTAPLVFWEMPEELQSELAQSRLIFQRRCELPPMLRRSQMALYHLL
jgi:hypothetical protein